METTAGLLGLTVPELERRYVRRGGRELERLLARAWARGKPGAALRSRLAQATSSAEREILSRGLRAVARDVEALGPGLLGHLLLPSLPLLSRVLHPTGLPRGAPGAVKSPVTAAYQGVLFASRRLEALVASDSRLLVETARRSLLSSVEALFGPLNQGRQDAEPVHLAGLIARLWPLTRAPGLRSVVPGTFRMEGRLGTGEESVLERESHVERVPSIQELVPRMSVPGDGVGLEEGDELPEAHESSPREGIERVRLRWLPAAPGCARTGVLTAGGPVFPPEVSPLPVEPGSLDFWRERAARERLLREHLPWLFMLMGALGVQEDAPTVGTLAMRELMAGLARPESRPLAFCRLLEAERPSARVEEEGAQGGDWLESIVQRAFPGEGAGCQESRRLLVRVLGGWWKGPPCEEAPTGWRWLPPSQRGPPGTRRWVPPRSSVAWEEWPGMAAATAPVRFLLEHEGHAMEGRWSPALRLALGLEVDVPLASQAPVVRPSEDVRVGEGMPPEVIPPPEPVPPVVEPVAVTMEDRAPVPPEVSLLSSSMWNWIQRE